MDIFDMECFIAICNYKSITKAAESMNISQSALSRRVISMENELKTELLIRHSRSVETTVAGERLLRDCTKVVSRMKNLKQDLQYMAHKDKISIGYLEDLNELCVLLDKMEELHYPDLYSAFAFVRCVNSLPVQDLLEGSIDMLFTLQAEVENLADLDYETVLENDLALIVPQGHRLWNKNKIKAEDITEEWLICTNNPDLVTKTAKESFDHLRRFGIHTENIVYVGNMIDEMMAVLSGAGLGLTGVYGVKDVMLPSKVRKIILDVPHIDSGNFVLAYRKDNEKIAKFVAKLSSLL